jgi:hypothetical protein
MLVVHGCPPSLVESQHLGVLGVLQLSRIDVGCASLLGAPACPLVALSGH